jgi:hypothetical protein
VGTALNRGVGEAASAREIITTRQIVFRGIGPSRRAVNARSRLAVLGSGTGAAARANARDRSSEPSGRGGHELLIVRVPRVGAGLSCCSERWRLPEEFALLSGLLVDPLGLLVGREH